MDSRLFAQRVLPADTFRHAERVAQMLPPAFQDVAYLHDVIEDTEYDTLALSGFATKNDLYVVDILTRKETQTYFEYIDFIAISKNRKAIMVKLADITDHLEQKATLKPSLEKRYLKAFGILTQADTIAFSEFKTWSGR